MLNSTDLTQYAILHFATHGVFDPRNPANSGLFLSMVNRDAQRQNGFIGLQDIYALKARVDLVVLSACRTGLGKEVKGEGLIGVTRGFMNAGASSAVASLWSVDDEATAELMKNFYANMLREGMPPAAALRAAQNTVRKDPRWASPYYWAAFTFQGDYDRKISVLPSQSFTYRYLARLIPPVLLVLTVFLGWFVWRYRTRSKNAITPQ
jgi:CHAT domain-containing protein